MRYILVSLVLFFFVIGAQAQNMSAKQINQKMTEIRQNTNWDDPAEAKKANEEIKKLSKQLMMVKQKVDTSKDDPVQEIKKENIEYNSKVWNQIMKSFKQGKTADILLGEPTREEIIEEYKDDESPVIKSQGYLDEITLLVIDMSLKTVQRTIDQMDKFKSIKTLVITGGSSGSPVDLNDLLTRAKNYPLEELYIINFKGFVTSIPKQIGKFKKLNLFSVINNELKALPQEVASFTSLKTLYADINPITTLLPVVVKLKQLEVLGIGKTSVSESEIGQLKQELPNCEILLQ